MWHGGSGFEIVVVASSRVHRFHHHPRTHTSCLTLPLTQILILNSMSTPQEREILKAKVMADMERAKAVITDIA